jgi:hypothetical protein
VGRRTVDDNPDERNQTADRQHGRRVMSPRLTGPDGAASRGKFDRGWRRWTRVSRQKSRTHRRSSTRPNPRSSARTAVQTFELSAGARGFLPSGGRLFKHFNEGHGCSPGNRRARIRLGHPSGDMMERSRRKNRGKPCFQVSIRRTSVPIRVIRGQTFLAPAPPAQAICGPSRIGCGSAPPTGPSSVAPEVPPEHGRDPAPRCRPRPVHKPFSAFNLPAEGQGLFRRRNSAAAVG